MNGSEPRDGHDEDERPGPEHDRDARRRGSDDEEQVSDAGGDSDPHPEQ